MAFGGSRMSAYADIAAVLSDVRFRGKADMTGMRRDVRF
jgi:hypothetical protein